MIKIGMMIGDRYEILEKIGTGGMSDVYKAKCHKLNRYVAIKVLKQEFSENANFVSKFRIEAQEGMGTTVVVASCMGRFLQVANVGDSRLYVVNREIRQITRDHSLVEEMIRMGGLDRADARNHPDKNIITRAVGAEDHVEPDFFTVELREGDTVLMCSDGLTNMLEDEEIRMIISGARDLVEKAERLVEAANANGGRDNISVILIEPCA